MDAQNEKDRRWYGAELMGNQCWCDSPKKPGFSFCFNCYKRLPPEMQKALYYRIGQGYEQAYEAAVKWLGENDQ